MTITAKIIKDSITPWGKRITTFELEYPRIVHSELMTHRQFSRNSASSRAIPISKVIEQVKTNPAMPFKWGKNKAGMQADEDLTEHQQKEAETLWLASRDNAVAYATTMMQLGLHKQVVNRILEPYQHIKVVMTTTEYNNWEWLRLHKDADPTIMELARVMKLARDASEPDLLQSGMWHLPYIHTATDDYGHSYFNEYGEKVTLEQAQKISCSSCAQVSYRKLDTSLEKSEDIYTKLVDSEPVHASAFEHVAMVFDEITEDITGITSVKFVDPDIIDESNTVHLINSGNFTGGWIQYRQLIPNNCKQ